MRKQPFLLSATVDFPDDVSFGPYSLELLDKMMRQIRDLGVQRVYWLYYCDVDPRSYWAGTTFDYSQYGPATLETIGEPLKAVTPIAHSYGLEIFGVLKPFNTGISGTYPQGSPDSGSTNTSRIGGSLQQVSPFIERNPDTRVKRRPWNAPSRLDSIPIQTIRLIKKDDSPTRIQRDRLQIWTSQDNYRYQKRTVKFSLTDEVKASSREVRDFYGELITDRGDPVRTLTLEGLNLKDRFILLTTDFEDEVGDFQNAPSSMIEAYGPDPEPLPIVIATRSAMWVRPRDFRDGGLEFDSGMGPFQVQLDTNNSSTEGTMFGIVKKSKWNWGGCIAFARGKNNTLACTPCEAYPKVQKLWMGWVDRLIDAGVDGVDVRISAHGSLTDEPLEYGFNDLLLTQYQQEFGLDPLQSNADLRQFSRLRGRYYNHFIREASHRIRKAGKKFQVHVHAEAFGPNPCHGQLMGFPANIHFDWQGWLREGLADGITLRTTWFEAPEADRGIIDNALNNSVAEEALELCIKHEIPVYLNRYLKRTNTMAEYVSDLEKIYHDRRFSGFDIYEFAHLSRPTVDGSQLVSLEDRISQIQAMSKKLGIL